MKKELLTLFCVAGISFPALGGTYNIAPKARATASSSLNADGDASKVNDGYIRLDNAGEWVSAAQMPYWQQLPYPWIRLDWDEEVTLSRIVLYDRPTGDAHTAGGDLFFSDGTRIGVVGIPDNGEPKVVEFAPKRVRWVKFEVNDAVGSHVGLSEIEAFPPAGAGGDFVSQVNPFIETTKGRYFFFITGNQPFGMIGAAPLTRNRNQYGGGYNYNSTEVLGFPQIHNWVLAGLTLMPTTGNVDPTLGEGHWKSHFRHEGEIAQPGYHRLFLEDYGIWVEQTATDRTGFYRLTFTRDMAEGILWLLGYREGDVETSEPCEHGTYNLTGSGEPASWADVARRVFDLRNGNGGRVVPVVTAEYYAGAKGPVSPRPKCSALGLSKIQATGFELHDWESELEKCVGQLVLDREA